MKKHWFLPPPDLPELPRVVAWNVNADTEALDLTLDFLPRLSDSSSDSAQAISQLGALKLETLILDSCLEGLDLHCFLADVLADSSELCNSSRVSR